MPIAVDRQQLGLHFATGDLIHRAFARRLVGPPTEEFRAVTESALGEVIVADFHDELGIERFPFARALGAPATRAAGRFASESTALFDWFFQLLDLGREFDPFLCG